MSRAAQGSLRVLREDTPGPGPTARPGPGKAAQRYETIDSILLTEPRIEAIRRELQALLALVELEVDGEPVSIDGFRLRDIAHWADYPTSLSDIFWHLSSVCNLGCEFCYEKGNPDGFPIQNTPRMSTPEEIETRLAHYDPATGRGIFSVRTAINEPFANKNALAYLRRMREISADELISFVTNGSYITEDIARALKALQPIFFNLSVYSTDPQIRRTVLRDFRGDRAIQAIGHLARHRVPYMTNLVMWPSIPFEDMERTIAHVAEHRATVVRVCLGGYSRYLEGDFERFRVEDYWPRVVEAVERLRPRYSIPILIEPNSYVRHDTDAVVDGVIVGSPAQRAGIRRGDCILAVDGQPVGSRMQLLSALRRSTRVRFRPPGVMGMVTRVGAAAHELAQLTLARGDEIHEVVLDRFDPESMETYPYAEIARFDDFMYGLIVTDTLRYASIKAARQRIEAHGARTVLVLTSTLIEPILGYMLARTHAFDGFDVHIRVAENRYFGGNINVGDLLVVEDFVHAIQRFVREQGIRPDLVLIPASPFATSPWFRDLTGRPMYDVERLSGVPVEAVPCAPITF